MHARLTRNVIGGGLLVVGGAALAVASLGMNLGTPVRMGPGFLPFSLGILIALIGAAIALFETDDGPAVDVRLQLRPAAFVLGAIVTFGLLLERAGIVPTAAAAAFLASFAIREVGLIGRLVLAAAISAICLLIFKFGLGLSVASFGS